MNRFCALLQPVLQPCTAESLMGKDAAVGAPQPGSRALAEVLRDEALCAAGIAALAERLQPSSQQAAVLLWQKQFVRGFLGQWLANALLGQVVAVDLAAFYVDGIRLKGLQWAQGQRLDEAQTAAALAQFAGAIAALFIRQGAHANDAWGNIALAVADPWMKARVVVADNQALAQSHADFLRLLPPPLQSAMLVLPYERPDGSSALHFRRRRSCCRKYEVPGKSHCSTCSKVALTEQLRRLEAD